MLLTMRLNFWQLEKMQSATGFQLQHAAFSRRPHAQISLADAGSKEACQSSAVSCEVLAFRSQHSAPFVSRMWHELYAGCFSWRIVPPPRLSSPHGHNDGMSDLSNHWVHHRVQGARRGKLHPAKQCSSFHCMPLWSLQMSSQKKAICTFDTSVYSFFCREDVDRGKHGKSLCREHKTALKEYKADTKAILKIALRELSKCGTELKHEAKD